MCVCSFPHARDPGSRDANPAPWLVERGHVNKLMTYRMLMSHVTLSNNRFYCLCSALIGYRLNGPCILLTSSHWILQNICLEPEVYYVTSPLFPPSILTEMCWKAAITPHVAWVHFSENMATNAWMAYKGKSIVYETCFSWAGRVGGGGWACLLEEWAILGCHWKLQCATPYLTSLLFPTDLWSRSTQVSDQPLFGLAQFWPRVPSNGITVDIPFIGKLKNISSCLHSLSLSLMGLVFLSSHLLYWTVDRTCHHPLHL